MLYRCDEQAVIKILKNVYEFIKTPISVFDDNGLALGKCHVSGSTGYCCTVRRISENLKKCRECDRNACAFCYSTGITTVYRCHAGLYEAVVPIIHDGINFGYIIFGQFRLEGEDVDPTAYASELAVDANALKEEYGKLQTLTRSQVNAAAELLRACMGQVFYSDLIYTPTNEIARLVKKHIDTNLSSSLNVELIAAEFYVSTRYLQNIFKDTYGLTVKKYILDKRIKLAAHLLITTDHTVAEIADMSGFSDYNNFIQRFKSTVGQTPLKFRHTHSV
jgi:AraC-like DNA-binding protein